MFQMETGNQNRTGFKDPWHGYPPGLFEIFLGIILLVICLSIFLYASGWYAVFCYHAWVSMKVIE